MTELSLMQRFADPALFAEMSKSELVQGALITTLMGMGTTFVVLVLLWCIIALVSKIINKSGGSGGNPAPAQTAAPKAAESAAPVAKAEASVPAGPGTELIAVIAAAIAAMEGTSPGNLIIRKINRVSGNSTPWSRAGVSEVIDSRKF